MAAPPAESFESIAVGDSHACGIRANGTVACWGAGTTDECGGSICRQARPPPGVFEQVTAGVFHTCAMRADRTVECWGWNGDGTELSGITTPPPSLSVIG